MTFSIWVLFQVLTRNFQNKIKKQKQKILKQVKHSFPEDGFKLGENIYWGSGSTWTPNDAVKAWADEEKYYTYATNTCASGQQCGHYTQIVWRNTRKIGCARVVCDTGDVFMTCNYDPVGNYVGQRPYWLRLVTRSIGFALRLNI